MFDVRDFGAAGDGLSLDTAAIQRAIDACAMAGGGTVHCGTGTYVTGALFLRDRVTLELEAGATLLASQDPADYPVIHSRWEGVNQETHAPLIGGHQLEDIAIVGRGTIDGQGAAWWQRFQDGTLRYPRPRLISFTDCQKVLIEGVTLMRSPGWTVNPVRCHNVTIDKVTILNPPDSPNTDGINPDSCNNVRISNCHIDVGDDCIAIKSGTEAEDPDRRLPCENITITNCIMIHGHGGVVIGSEMSGGVRNIAISNCIFEGTDRGIRLKSRRGRGGVIEDVRVTNVIMTGALCPFTVNLYYACGAWGNKTVADRQPRAVDAGTPRVRRIHLSHITARDAKLAAGWVWGLPEMPIEGVTLDDVWISMAAEAEPGYPEMADGVEPMQRAGLFVRHVRGLRLRDVEITGQRGPGLLLDDTVE
ncbi:MAG: glycoside hydrolase family 28 protein [Anaerolineae bacterium]|nr:glycoside hydrolase family 28 protein [Anaerolineae bacterium]